MTDIPCVDGVLQDAKALLQLGRFNEAEQLYSKALFQLGPQKEEFYSTHLKQLSAWVYNDRGHCRYMQVYFDEAVEDYTKAIQLDPTLAAAYYNRGTVHYRLYAAKSPGTGERQALLQQATKDFEEAVRLAPDNQEFQEGLKNCKEMDPEKKGDGNVIPKNKKNVVIKWPRIPYGKLIKLLFLLDNGDKTTGATDADRDSNIAAAAEAKNAFHSVLRGEKCSFHQVLSVLQKRVQELVEYPFIRLLGDTEAANRSVRKQDEDLLTLTQACEYLGIECHNLDEKVKKVQEKLFLEDKEMHGSFFIYAENLRMNRICDNLTPTLVYQLLEITKKDEVLNKLLDTELDVSEEKVNKIEGYKEALFFYMIRLLEEHDKLNRVYTDKLEDLLERLSKETKSEEEQRRIMRLATTLGDYPSECLPAGHCVVFCVTKDRDGAQGEINKVKNVFEGSLGYTVQVIENPTQEILEDCRHNLKKQKYRFYDSIVYWFMTHGSETALKLADDKRYERKEIIDSFSKLDNFSKKPKIFFMASCRGDSAIAVRQRGGIRVTVDGSSGGMTFTEIPEQCYNITAVYYQMDRLVANATLPEHFSFRLPDGGSLYVDTVCRLLEKHRGENITQVLERACNRMHQILFSCHEKFQGEAKQACNYETTFQKTFLVPSTFPEGCKTRSS